MGGRVALFALCLGVLTSVGCGGSSSSSSSTASLRVLQASPSAPAVNILVDGKDMADNLGYANSTGYLSVKSGSRHIQAVPASGGSPVLDQTLSAAASSNQTLAITGSGSISSAVLADGGTTATTGDGHVRILNASSTMQPPDVYIVPVGGSLSATTLVTSSLAFDKDTGYQLVSAGNFEVFLTAAGTTNAYLATGPLNLAASANQTIIALDASGGGFTYVLLTDQ